MRVWIGLAVLGLLACLAAVANGQGCRKTTELTADKGSFTDGSKEDEKYTNNLDLCWSFPAGKKVRINFPRVAVERGYDYVRVYRGGSVLDDDVSAGESFEGEKIIVWFHTDDSVVDFGFTANYEVLGSGGGGSGSGSGGSSGVVEISYDFAHSAKCRGVDKYRTSGALVIRRGCTFKFSLKGGSLSKLDLINGQDRISISSSGSTGAKGFTLTTKGAEYEVKVPSDAPVGWYDTEFYVGGKKYDGPGDVYIIFNPHLTGNPEHCPAEERNYEEYLYRENGAIWVGSTDNNGPKPWIFNQFDETILRVTTQRILSGLSMRLRSDPIFVSRHLTNKLTSSNPGGMLWGRWDGEYADGASPSSWSGSLEIFDQFERTSKPVKYGQCWVFSGILTSSARALGLPTRPVTNFESAHERPPFDLKLEQRWVKEGDKYRQESSTGSIWNFHVWAETCISRPDLKMTTPSWQAIDATPQEKSDGYYQLGPASLEVIKSKKFTNDTKYDTAFVASETDCDVVLYVDGKYLRTDTRQVGPFTYTRTPSAGPAHRPLDVSPLYKTESRRFLFLEESAETPDTSEPVSVEFFVPKSEVRVGDDFNVSLKLSANSNGKNIKCNTFIEAHACSYTGHRFGSVGSFDKAVDFSKDGKAGSSTRVSYTVAGKNAVKYLPKGANTVCLDASVVCSSPRFTWVQSKRKDWHIPRLNMLGRVNLVVGHKINFNVFFTNPLEIKLKKAKVHWSIDGSPFDRSVNTFSIDDIGPRSRVSFQIKGKCSTPGTRAVFVTLDTEELFDIFGYAEVECAPRKASEVGTIGKIAESAIKQLESSAGSKSSSSKDGDDDANMGLAPKGSKKRRGSEPLNTNAKKSRTKVAP